MLNSLTHTAFKPATKISCLALAMFIASCSTPNIEAPSETDKQTFIEITDSTIKPSVETTIEIPLESALETTIETAIETAIETLPETSDETLSKAATESSCVAGETDCHRFDYSSPVGFLNSVVNHAHKNSMAVPIEILSNLTIDAFIQVESLEQAEEIIGLNPEHMLIIGQRIIKKDMPYEWLFAAEQAFLRSWSNLGR
jgi:hypothetical protein|tara:strand:+ start:29 stop:628 length:600 start_codon:yes stop_codon:yes gene_type:complete